MQAPGSELSRIKTATKLDQGWDHLDVGLCDSSGHSAGPNCLHIGLLITPAEQMHPGRLLVPLHQDQIHICESVEAHRTLPARASEQSVLSSNVAKAATLGHLLCFLKLIENARNVDGKAAMLICWAIRWWSP